MIAITFKLSLFPKLTMLHCFPNCINHMNIDSHRVTAYAFYFKVNKER